MLTKPLSHNTSLFNIKNTAKPNSGSHDNFTNLFTYSSAENEQAFFSEEKHNKKMTYIYFVLGFNDTSTLVGHFVSSPGEKEKRDRNNSRGDEREGQGRKRNMNESKETEEIKPFPTLP